MLNKLKRAALGAHTPHDKATAASKPVPMPLPAQVRILMSQHIGAPAKPIVAKGDRVLAGQKIAESGGFVSAPIYASVSGTVKTIETRRVVTGDLIQSIGWGGGRPGGGAWPYRRLDWAASPQQPCLGTRTS